LETTLFLIPPFDIQIEDALVTVWEVLKLPPDRYNCTVTIKLKGVESKRYGIVVKDQKDLRNKLKIEITKLKFIDLSMGRDYLRQVMTS